MQIDLRLVKVFNSIIRSSVSFCLSASRIAPSLALEFDASPVSLVINLREIFLSLSSVYQTPTPAVAFSQQFFTAKPSVLIMVVLPQARHSCTCTCGRRRRWCPGHPLPASPTGEKDLP